MKEPDNDKSLDWVICGLIYGGIVLALFIL